MVAGLGAVTTCFPNGLLTSYTGGANGIRPTTLNIFLDMFDAANQDKEDNPDYPPAPVVTKDYVAGTTCAPGSSATTTNTTMPLPPDDCFLGGTGCTSYNGEPRFGNGDWSQGRMRYVETNYSTEAANVGTVAAGETVTVTGANAGTYHRADPFRPLSQSEGGDGTTPWIAGNPIVPAGGTRWDYYRAEVAYSLYDNPSAVYDGADDYSVEDGTRRTTPRELIRDITNAGGTVVHDRRGASLPQCSTSGGAPIYSVNPRRRTIIAAVVDCDAWSSELRGGSGAFQATYFVELFLLNPSRPNGTTVEIFGELVSGALNRGGANVSTGTFRDVVQLYR